MTPSLMKASGLGLAFLILLLTACQQPESRWLLDSPGKKVQVAVELTGTDGTGKLTYTVSRENAGNFLAIMDPSPLGIEREDGIFVNGLEPVSSEIKRDLEDHYTLVSGKQLQRDAHWNEMQLQFRNQDKQKVNLVFRAYDDGIAFRYHFPGKSEHSLRVTGEGTGFNFMEGNFWAHPYDTLAPWSPGYETYYRGPIKVGTPAPWNKNGWAFPILVESEGTWMLVSEAGMDGTYGASHLEAECDNGLYRIRFAEPGEACGYYEHTSHAPLPWSTPWRFIAIGDSPRAIVETNLPTDLAAPSEIEDASWIRPGRASWSWWSEGSSPRDYDRVIPFIDLAAKMGWEYSLVDAGWNHMKNGDVATLATYAEEKGVGLLLWYNSGGKHNTVEAEPRDLMDDPGVRRDEFERISNLGIRGVKVDFFQSDKQEIIGQYLEILEDAAACNLVVNFHGCTLPRGWRRTWPNLLTMESVKGGECYRFDNRFPAMAPSHLTIVPFTRNAVGPCDYTPGGFSDNTYPHLTTFGFELALPVVIESGIMHHTDTPGQTLGLPGFAVDFLKNIPVAWDETLFMAGYPGSEVVLARRKGDTWYLGAINGEDREKEMTIDLSATGAAPARVRLITDGISRGKLIEKELVPDDGKMTIRLAPYGGLVGTW